MRESDLLLLSPDKKRDLYMTFVRDYILSRGNLKAQDHNLKILESLEELWKLSENQKEQWYRTAAQHVEEVGTFLDDCTNRKWYQ